MGRKLNISCIFKLGYIFKLSNCVLLNRWMCIRIFVKKNCKTVNETKIQGLQKISNNTVGETNRCIIIHV